MKYKCQTCFKQAEPGDERRVCTGGSTQPFISQLQLIIYDFHSTSCALGAQNTSASPALTGAVPIATCTARCRMRPQLAITAGSWVWSPVRMGGTGWQWVVVGW